MNSKIGDRLTQSGTNIKRCQHEFANRENYHIYLTFSSKSYRYEDAFASKYDIFDCSRTNQEIAVAQAISKENACISGYAYLETGEAEPPPRGIRKVRLDSTEAESSLGWIQRRGWIQPDFFAILGRRSQSPEPLYFIKTCSACHKHLCTIIVNHAGVFEGCCHVVCRLYFTCIM